MPALVGRTYRITKGDGLSVQALEQSVGVHASIEGVKRGRGAPGVGEPDAGHRRRLPDQRADLRLAPVHPAHLRRLPAGGRGPMKDLGLAVFIAVTGLSAGPTPAITPVTNAAQSSVPMIGYTITYTLSNFLRPLTGLIFVA